VNPRASDREPSYYESAYRDYEKQNPAKKLAHYTDVIEKRSPTTVPRVLDVGCGPGMFLHYLAQMRQQWVLTGVDFDSQGVETARTLVPAADVTLGQAGSLPFDDSRFDVITAWDVLEHVEDLEEALSEIRRCLRSGGLFVMTTPVYDGLTGFVVRGLDRDPTHVHKQSRAFWLQVMSDQFSSVQWHGVFRILIAPSVYIHKATQRLRSHAPAVLISGINR
jgi:ubiquinone/menaquinone biosynthesis C-methylase UbiE